MQPMRTCEYLEAAVATCGTEHDIPTESCPEPARAVRIDGTAYRLSTALLWGPPRPACDVERVGTLRRGDSQARVAELEQVLWEYVGRYGATERASWYLGGRSG